MPRKPAIDARAAEDSELLHTAIQAIIDGMGRGGLSHVADRLGVTPTMLKKRLRIPGKAFDAPTLRAAALILEIRNGQEDQHPEQP
jgi:hypothetical protein